MDNKVKCWCKHCKKELLPSHTGPCPHCGKTGKDCKVTATAVVGVKASMSATHKPKWSSASLTLLSIWVAIFVTLAVPGIQLLPFRPGVNYVLLLCLLLVVGGVLWWKRYGILMLIRKLEDKLGGEG